LDDLEEYFKTQFESGAEIDLNPEILTKCEEENVLDGVKVEDKAVNGEESKEPVVKSTKLD
jgi:hypothetical protein